MRISIVCVGKIKEKFYVQAVCEYVKRLSRYCKLDIIELPDEKTPENSTESSIFPSIASAMTYASSFNDERILSPSFALIARLSCSPAFSGVFSSGSSIISSLQYLDSLFTYSQTACT